MPQPNNLKPIPTQPWDDRPEELPLDREEARTALWVANGNVSEAAAILKVSPSRFRRFVNSSDYLRRELEEAREQLVDRAEEVVREALHDPDRCDPMARFVLSSQGKGRGWGTGGGPSVNVKASGNVVFQWADGSSVSIPDPNIVDVTPLNGLKDPTPNGSPE
jgi:hypothetical protein